MSRFDQVFEQLLAVVEQTNNSLRNPADQILDVKNVHDAPVLLNHKSRGKHVHTTYCL